MHDIMYLFIPMTVQNCIVSCLLLLLKETVLFGSHLTGAPRASDLANVRTSYSEIIDDPS